MAKRLQVHVIPLLKLIQKQAISMYGVCGFMMLSTGRNNGFIISPSWGKIDLKILEPIHLWLN